MPKTEGQILDMVERRLNAMLGKAVDEPVNQETIRQFPDNVKTLLLDVETERRRLADADRSIGGPDAMGTFLRSTDRVV